MPRPKKNCLENAYDLLSRRDHAIKDLAGKLKKKGYEGHDIAQTITHLEENGFLNDAKYALNRAKSRAESSKWGATRIKQELYQHGVAEEHIIAALNHLESPEDTQWDDPHNFTQTAKELITRKYKPLPPSSSREETQKYRKKQLDFLLRRGFSYTQAKAALEGDIEEEY